MKKKILLLSQLYPYPPVSGGRIKTLNTIKCLAKEYNIYAIFISEEIPTKKDISKLTKLGIKVKVFYSKTILASVKDDLANLIKNYMKGISHYVFQYTHKPAFSYINHAIAKFKPDIIHVDHLNLAQYLPKEKKQIWILEHHNVESYLLWTRFVHTSKLTRKFYLFLETFITFFYEFRTLRKFDHIFTISEPENARLKKLFFVKNCSPQPLFYRTSPIKPIPHKNYNLVFIGTLGWPPNEDAIEWFSKSIYPKIFKEFPNTTLHIIGKPGIRYNPDGKKNVVLHGFLKNFKPVFAKADVFIAPFRMGGGLRLKCMTALASGIPLVTTPLGIEGIMAKNNKECLIGRNSKEFAWAVIRLLKSSKLRDKLRKNAIKFIKEKHGQEQNKKFLNFYKKLTEKNY